MKKTRDRREYNKQWRAEHQEQLRAYEKARSPQKLVQRQSYYARNREKVLAGVRAYRAANIEKLRAYDRNRPNKLERRREHNQKLKDARLTVIAAYGGCCKCCGESYPELLNIDHVRGDGSKHRKESGCSNSYGMYVWLQRHGFPKDNYQLLCFNCNIAKSRYGRCPHQIGKSILEYGQQRPFTETAG